MNSIISVKNVEKVYPGGFKALNGVDLEIEEGEIFALLGPNGAGKTTLISSICGITTPSSGSISVGGHDIIRDFRKARGLIGLVPQELTTDAFETVWDTINFTRGLFGKPKDHAYIENLLEKLSLIDKKTNKLMMLSGGMKRRVMIAKALSHQPRVLFLDEPTAGVDVELRKDMWQQVHELRKTGVTIILTTHYIDEAEEMADRIGIINKGEVVLVDKKSALMKKLGKKQLHIELASPIEKVPDAFQGFDIKATGNQLVYTYDAKGVDTGVPKLLSTLSSSNLDFVDIHTNQSSLEEIFVELVNQK